VVATLATTSPQRYQVQGTAVITGRGTVSCWDRGTSSAPKAIDSGQGASRTVTLPTTGAVKGSAGAPIQELCRAPATNASDMHVTDGELAAIGFDASLHLGAVTPSNRFRHD
jgi:hypothetical protein